MYARVTIDVSQGDDTEEQVRAELLKDVELDRVVARPTGVYVAGGNPEWSIEGDARDLFVVLLNYVGSTERNELPALVQRIKFDAEL